MKRKSVIVLVVAVALIFGIGGYLIGNIDKQEATEEYKDAYKKGWSHWFSGYGMNGEGMQYIDYYENGRSYDAVFTNTKDAFFAGYKDGFFCKS